MGGGGSRGGSAAPRCPAKHQAPAAAHTPKQCTEATTTHLHKLHRFERHLAKSVGVAAKQDVPEVVHLRWWVGGRGDRQGVR